MVEETTVLSKAELRHLFPEATIFTEAVLGIPIVHCIFPRESEPRLITDGGKIAAKF